MNFIMWLSVIDGSDENRGLFGPNKLFYKPQKSFFIPTPEVDDVILWSGEDDDGTQTEGPLWSVKRRYMGHGGLWHIELSKMVLNPNEFWVNAIRNRLASGKAIIHERSWYPESDGDPYPNLIRGGWREYNSATWAKDND